MLKQTINYTDFDGNPAEETLYFNLTKIEIADNLDLKEQVEKIQKSFEGESRTLETHEVQAILALVKRLMCLSYGVRSADGKRFIKSDELWTEFTQTAVYDEFLFSLFKDPQNAFAFILGILPQDIRAEAEAMATTNPNQEPLLDSSDSESTQISPTSAPAPSPIPKTPDRIAELLSDTTDGMGETQSVVLDDDRPAWIRENREPTQNEIREATPEQLREAYTRKLRTDA
jgi:hypothetical protein